MTEKISFRQIKAYNHIPLHQILPLPIPISVHIDPSNKCNFRCIFCPTGDKKLLDKINRPYGVMDLELFSKIINDFKELKHSANKNILRLHLYKDGEPLLNKNFTIMARLAKDAGIADFVETTTNASLLNDKIVKNLVNCDLDVIRISVEGTSEEIYKKLTRTFFNYRRIIENVKALYIEKEKNNFKTHIHVKIINLGLSDIEKDKFFSDFSQYCDSINIDEVMGWSGTIKDWTIGYGKKAMDGQTSLTAKKVCPEVFSKLSVNFDGSVSICCVDWTHGTIVGDLRKESILDVWNGDKLNKFRMLHLNGKRDEIPACNSCQYLQGIPEYSNVDEHIDKLIAIYKRD